MTIHELPTPALLLDADLFESNISRMSSHILRSGKALRPHAKAHKCVHVAKRQIAAGAVGVCVATVAEAELMVRAGVPGVLLTSPIAETKKAGRMVVLSMMSPDPLVVVDHREQLSIYASAASVAGVSLNVLVDLDVGDHRTGVAPGEPAAALAEAVMQSSHLRFRGLQAYSVRGSHEVGVEARRELSRTSLEGAIMTRELLTSRGIPVEMVTGGSTGTYEVDASSGLTELQAGSYVYMDAAYRKIGGVKFTNALTVLATVISANHPDLVTIDAGFKAFATDRPFGPDPMHVTGVRYEWAGDEFGYLHLDQPSRKIGLGTRLEFIPPHCDPTVNLYDRIHVCRGESVIDVWPVMDRCPRALS